MGRFARFFLVSPLFFVLLAGCSKGGPTPANFKGKVMYKGEPVTGGMITLYAKDTGAYPFALNADGTFNKPDLPTGELTVCVSTDALNPNKPTYGRGKNKQQDSTPAGAPSAVPVGEYRKIPVKYANPSTSDLKVTLHKGENEQVLELKD